MTPTHCGEAAAGSGSAYVFSGIDGVWTQVDKLNASDGASDDRFGASVALGRNTAVIGAQLNGDIAFRAGSAYVYLDCDDDGDVCALDQHVGTGCVPQPNLYGDVDIDLFDLFDLFAVLNAFSGIDPCCGGLP